MTSKKDTDKYTDKNTGKYLKLTNRDLRDIEKSDDSDCVEVKCYSDSFGGWYCPNASRHNLSSMVEENVKKARFRYDSIVICVPKEMYYSRANWTSKTFMEPLP